jgi:hypothetical protein
MSTSEAETTQTTPAPEVKDLKPIPRRRRKWRWIAAAILLSLAVWAAFDLYGPRQTNIRSFDPDEVARLDTAMWRSYYSRQRLLLFSQLAELLRAQFHFPFLRSNLVAYRAAKAAFVFKDGHSRTDYEKALPDLLSFYASLRKVSNVPFDTERAAKLELEWWIIHRERERHQPGDLERALAELAAEIYRVPAERLMEHARLRAEAMRIRDTKAAQGGVTEEDWQKIDQLLRASWHSLSQAVNS